MLLYQHNILFIHSPESFGFPFDQQIETTATWSCREVFPPMQVQNVQARWLLATFYAGCSRAAFWLRDRQREVTQQLAFISTSSFMLVCYAQVCPLESSLSKNYPGHIFGLEPGKCFWKTKMICMTTT